jgi:hypothetical protein
MVAMRRTIRSRVFASAIVGGVVLGSLLAAGAPAFAEDDPFPRAVTDEHFSPLDPVFAGGDGTAGAVGVRKVPNPVCATVFVAGPEANTDCEGIAPRNETTIAVNPTNGLNIIGGANDYQLSLSPGGTVYETIYSRAHVTFDGGHTWTTFSLNNQNAYTSTGDPAIAFDADGKAYYATLGFGWSQSNPCCHNPDVVVQTSGDGGRTWSAINRVASGTGVFTGKGTFNDKEYVAAWGHGNAIVTWTVFNQGAHGSYINSPIYASVTHDGGTTWSAGRAISGSAGFCVGSDGSNNCDMDQFSTPAVAADGSVYVSFVNFSNDSDGRDQYLVVKVSPTTGTRIAGPYRVGTVYDGYTDYPVSSEDRQTLQDSQFRTNPSGNLAADPLNAAHLSVIWSDPRNGLATDDDPYATTTNSDVIVSQSFDGGATWSPPAAITRANDQFQPWGGYDATGRLRVGFFDRSYDAANHQYGYTLATESAPGTLTFGFDQLTTQLSDPTQGTRWFSGTTPNPAYPHPTFFLGDYSGIAISPTYGAVALWTDLRLNVTFGSRSGTSEDAFFSHP